MFWPTAQQGTQVIFFHPGAEKLSEVFGYVSQLRERGIVTELYPDDIKQDKQYKYAEKRGIPYIAYVEESAPGVISIKNMVSKDRYNIKPEELGGFEF